MYRNGVVSTCLASGSDYPFAYRYTYFWEEEPDEDSEYHIRPKPDVALPSDQYTTVFSGGVIELTYFGPQFRLAGLMK